MVYVKLTKKLEKKSIFLKKLRIIYSNNKSHSQLTVCGNDAVPERALPMKPTRQIGFSLSRSSMKSLNYYFCPAQKVQFFLNKQMPSTET